MLLFPVVILLFPRDGSVQKRVLLVLAGSIDSGSLDIVFLIFPFPVRHSLPEGRDVFQSLFSLQGNYIIRTRGDFFLSSFKMELKQIFHTPLLYFLSISFTVLLYIVTGSCREGRLSFRFWNLHFVDGGFSDALFFLLIGAFPFIAGKMELCFVKGRSIVYAMGSVQLFSIIFISIVYDRKLY